MTVSVIAMLVPSVFFGDTRLKYLCSFEKRWRVLVGFFSIHLTAEENMFRGKGLTFKNVSPI